MGLKGTDRLVDGSWLGPYQIEGHCRSGGMAEVYLARRFGPSGFGEVVALKVIKRSLSSDPRFVKLFKDEASICARIVHPNVVRVVGFGEDKQGLFLAMPYIDGWSTAQLLHAVARAGKRLPIEVVVYIGIMVADALAAAHQTRDQNDRVLGILHCDVTPSNVLIDRHGSVQLIDFGAAIVRHWASDHGHTAPLRGKLRYMAPEQIRGEDVDERCDVYALGIVLWELLAATKAFDAANEEELLEMALFAKIRNIRDVRASVPEALASVITRAVSEDRGDRVSSAAELSSELATACPSGMLVDVEAFEPYFELLPNNTRASPGPSWVDDIARAYLQDEPPEIVFELGQRSG